MSTCIFKIFQVRTKKVHYVLRESRHVLKKRKPIKTDKETIIKAKENQSIAKKERNPK